MAPDPPMASTPPPMASDPLIASLLRPEAYDPPEPSVELLQTHISWILLAGERAYKIKKPVNLGFVDFSSAEQRAFLCAEELRLNRRLAPDLYLAVVPVHGPVERACFHGDGPVIERALQMRRFPQSALLPAALARGEVPAGAFDELAGRLAAFHAQAAVAGAGDPWGDPAAVCEPALANLEVLARDPADAEPIAELRRWSEAEGLRLTPLFQQRKADGRVREGHGDLHLGNMALLRGRIEVFDCLEFSPQLRWIDVISDLAFAVMDLQRRGLLEPAQRLLAGWLERSGDYPGLLTWRWYLVYRALVRAKVTALRLAQADLSAAEARDLRRSLAAYLAWAGEQIRPRRAALVITHGVSGSGKSHWARRLAQRPGWLQLRSDVERKRRYGLWGEAQVPAEPLPPADGLYEPAVSRWLYEERLPACAEAALAAGLNVVVDATFLLRSQRQGFRQLAARCSADFAVLRCEVEEGEARARLLRRRQQGGDPSDADAAVLTAQLARLEPIAPEEGLGTLGIVAGSEPGLRELDALLASAAT